MSKYEMVHGVKQWLVSQYCSVKWAAFYSHNFFYAAAANLQFTLVHLLSL